MKLSRNERARGERGAVKTTTTAIAITALLLLCEVAHTAHAFGFVPVLHSFATKDTSGDKLQTRLECQQGGGYAAAEATAALHEAVIEKVRAAGAGTTWYAYLGASTEANADVNCPQPVTASPINGGQSFGCYWRWNQGRWTELEDNTSLPLYISHVGLTFYIGNLWRAPVSTLITLYGSTGGFVDYFDTKATSASARRPGMLFGKDLVAVGTDATSTWSDNLATGGYTYAGYKYNVYYGNSKWSATDQAASKAYFWAVCHAQSPSRTSYEMENTTSTLQLNWWAIFFVVLFVVMLVVFLVTALCQDDEDMDEPPEDAPEWARVETQQAKQTKSFVSTRSFRGGADNNGSSGQRRTRGTRDDDDNASDASSMSTRSSGSHGQRQQREEQDHGSRYNSNGYQQVAQDGYTQEEDPRPQSRHSQNNWM